MGGGESLVYWVFFTSSFTYKGKKNIDSCSCLPVLGLYFEKTVKVAPTGGGALYHLVSVILFRMWCFTCIKLHISVLRFSYIS